MVGRLKSIINRLIRMGVNKDFHKFLLHAALILIPVGLFLGYIEYKLSQVVVSYSQKKHEVESQLDKIQVLALGSSNSYFGINPHFFSYYGFNFSYRAQWPYYDLKLMEKYLDRMPNLKLVIFSTSYFTFGTRFIESIDNWRLYFYSQYYHILPKDDANFLGYYHPFDPRSISKIALFGERTKYYLHNGTTNINEGEPDEDMTGWLNAGKKPCDLSLNIGQSGSNAHNLAVKVENYEKNLVYIGKLVELLRSRGVDFVFVELPQMPIYRDNVDPVKYAAMEASIKNFSKKYGVQHISYLKDKRFTRADFTDMPDHLNAVGAEKISKTINHDIVVPKMKVLLRQGLNRQV